MPNEAVANLKPELLELQALVRTLDADTFSKLHILEAADNELFGRYIQVFNFIDFNLRRIAERIVRAQGASEEDVSKIMSYPVKDLLIALKARMRRYKRTLSDLQGFFDRLLILERNWPTRHMIAHWAARRTDNGYIFMTSNKREAERVGQPFGEYSIAIACALIADVRGNAIEMTAFSNEWAEAVPRVERFLASH